MEAEACDDKNIFNQDGCSRFMCHRNWMDMS
ncbi:MAG: hypothetical protein IPK55_12540 [Streptococcus sp.]|nr:hypothetical protein [Streptococcus sp.]